MTEILRLRLDRHIVAVSFADRALADQVELAARGGLAKRSLGSDRSRIVRIGSRAVVGLPSVPTSSRLGRCLPCYCVVHL